MMQIFFMRRINSEVLIIRGLVIPSDMQYLNKVMSKRLDDSIAVTVKGESWNLYF